MEFVGMVDSAGRRTPTGAWIETCAEVNRHNRQPVAPKGGVD